jgi:hypothetical protein
METIHSQMCLTWISRDWLFMWISKFHVKFMWNSREKWHVKFTWKNSREFHVKGDSRETHVKIFTWIVRENLFTWISHQNFHMNFTWNLPYKKWTWILDELQLFHKLEVIHEKFMHVKTFTWISREQHFTSDLRNISFKQQYTWIHKTLWKCSNYKTWVNVHYEKLAYKLYAKFTWNSCGFHLKFMWIF